MILPMCAANFITTVNGRATECNYTYNANGYGSSTWTTTSPDFWVANTYSGKYPDNFDLRYQRTSATTATGGRCETVVLPEIGGDGVFSATLYIHSTVIQGTGVFTVAALPEPFDVEHELDLIVVNVAQVQDAEVWKVVVGGRWWCRWCWWW